MEEQEVLYETRQHASRPYTSNYPPLPKSSDNNKGSFLFRGVNQLKEKLSGYRKPKQLKKLSSLFISASGERVAVAAGNQITFLRKEDDYREPYGVFTSNSYTTFTVGTWSELHDVLGVADDAGTIYFIKANGEEITRVSAKNLKTMLPIVALIVQDDCDMQRSCLCSFSIVSADGSLQHIEISRESSPSISSSRISYIKGKPSGNICCLDHHPQLSLFVVVGGMSNVSLTSGATSESYFISLWREHGNSDLEQSCFIQFEGLYAKSNGNKGQLAYPKVLISPQAKFVATLDVSGCMHVFKLEKECHSLSKYSCGESCGSESTNYFPNGGGEYMNGIADFTWWSDNVLTLVKRSGLVTMLDIHSGLKVLEGDSAYSIPVVERVQQLQGHLFLLESKLFEDRYGQSQQREIEGISQVLGDGFHQVDYSRLQWSLISFSEKSLSEMYDLLISSRRYQDALDFANRHGLDKDDVMKSQWLNSSYGVNEINMFLSKIKDQDFVLSECGDKVGPTEDAVKALLEYGLRLTNQYRFSESENDSRSQIWDFRLGRLRLLQFRDRLETYLGINMGRFSVQDYSKFRAMPINEAAGALAESGKIGALNLLFKRHPYSLTPHILEILAAIPETVSVESYSQLLPGKSPPSSVAVREEDWVECEKMAHFLRSLPETFDINIKTEPIIKRSLGSSWPSAHELTTWYKTRARDIDSLSGQLNNSLCLIEFACRKGICELQQFREDISYLHQLVYCDDRDGNTSSSMSLVEWEQLSDYEKFRMMLNVVKEENVVEQLRDKAIPFMQTRAHDIPSGFEYQDSNNLLSVDNMKAESFLVRWLKEIAVKNKLDVCLMVIEEGCRDFENNIFFKDEAEAVDCALQCIYLCSVTDRWSTMAAILSKLPQLRDTETHAEELEKRLKLAEGHIEAGRLLAFYQVPKPINFFLEGHLDIKAIKQIIRLILSKFSRRQPSRSDHEWANMWHDIQSLREKAFPFLDMEYLLVEFCRGLLKAGKFSLARNYLKGTGTVALASEKAENIVIQAAREYFFSASSLSCPEIWKAKECLNLFPTSRNVKAEADIIEALTVHLPCLGVTILPLQYRQLKDPMEIIKMAITSQAGTYLHVDEIIEVAKLLGLSSSDEIPAVEEAIAREAAVAGDIQLAFDLCMVLTKKGHGPVWDLCAAIARGPALENMDINSRKQLLGFALSHCDEESISELLHAWKDLDVQAQCETLVMSSGIDPPSFSLQGQSPNSFPGHNYQDLFGLTGCSIFNGGASTDSDESHYDKVKEVLSVVAKACPPGTSNNSDSFFGDNGKIFSFVSSQLPWLLELTRKPENNAKLFTGSGPGNCYVSVRIQSVVTILCWLALNGFAPRDDLIVLLAKSIMEPPSTREDDILGYSFLLNLIDAVNGVDVIEEQLKTRKNYQEISSMMNIGMKYSLLHSSSIGCDDPTQRRELLLRNAKEKHTSPDYDEMDSLSKVQSSFWREWKLKLEEQKRVSDHSRVLERVIPGVETARFLSGDSDYIENAVFSLIDSVKLEKKRMLRDILKLADTYGLNRTEVLLRYLSSILPSEVWTNDDIMEDISDVKGEIISHAAEVIKVISSSVYPMIDGCNKQRLAFIYSMLSDCYLQLEETKEPVSMHFDANYKSTLGLAHYYEVLAQECKRVSFIESLNFKNIAGLHGLNPDSLSGEVRAHINKSNLEALAYILQTFAGIYEGPLPEGRDIYMYYVLGLLKNLEDRSDTELKTGSPSNLQNFISQLEQTYDSCRTYIRYLAHSDALDIMRQILTIIRPLHDLLGSIPDTSDWQECLIMLLSFWIRLTEEMDGSASRSSVGESLRFDPGCLMSCLKIFIRLVVEDIISPAQGWTTILNYINHGLSGDFQFEVFIFCRSMIFSGCGFGAIAEVFSEAVASTTDAELMDLSTLYLKILESILQELVNESHDQQYLYNLLSSLSKLEGDLDSLKSVREVVWERMAKFSNNIELPSQVRVQILEIMQYASGGVLKGFSTELLSKVLPWEGWDGLPSGQSETAADQDLDNSSRFTSTLVALKSTQLASCISPSVEITPDDLSDVDTAVSCFLKLCAAADSKSHLDALKTILEEWEGLFVSGKDEEVAGNAYDAGNNWSSDDWDEGWESFQEVEPLEEEKEKTSPSIHPLHRCWEEIFKKLIAVSHSTEVVRLIDLSIPRCSCTLLDEDGTRNLSQILLGEDCFLALKIVLLLPYETIQLQCLDAVEDKLKQEGISEMIGGDLELLVLILSSGAISTIITKSCYGTTFSYLCYLVGNFSCQCQEAQITTEKGRNKCGISEQDWLLFRKIIFPSFVTELVKADQQILAGFLVTKFMHTNSSLSLLSIAEASLHRYLQGQLNVLQHDKFPTEEMKSGKKLWNTISSLQSKLINMIPSVLPLLSSDAK